MIKLYSIKKAWEIVRDNHVLISRVSTSCRIPPAYLEAVLLK